MHTKQVYLVHMAKVVDRFICEVNLYLNKYAHQFCTDAERYTKSCIGSKFNVLYIYNHIIVRGNPVQNLVTYRNWFNEVKKLHVISKQRHQFLFQINFIWYNINNILNEYIIFVNNLIKVYLHRMAYRRQITKNSIMEIINPAQILS